MIELMLMKKNLLISFSGGRTSAFMTKWLLDNASDQYNMAVVFANTGREHEKTLEFVDKCDRLMGFGTIWIEAVTENRFRAPLSYRITDFRSASRDGEPFEESIRRYGIPNSAAPRCSQNLKAYPIRAFVRNELGWRKRDYETAIGIRVDEIDRISVKAKKDRLIYPLISMLPTTKGDVVDFWKKQSFDLEIPSYHGNCKTCWKKSKRKLMTIAVLTPEAFDWDTRMEERYEMLIPTGNAKLKPPVRFHRGNMSAKDIIDLSRHPFALAIDELEVSRHKFDPEFDFSGGCEESCEAF